MFPRILTWLPILPILLFTACAPSRPVDTPAAQLQNEKERLPRTDPFMQAYLKGFPAIDSVLSRPGQWRVSIIYTRIDRDKKNEPRFRHYYYDVDPARYSYPASTIKLPLAALALQKLRAFRYDSLHAGSTMITEKGPPGIHPVYNDPQAADGRPTIEQYIRKIFLVSDNEASNRLYEFLGQEAIHGALRKLGYDSVRILHRVGTALSEAANRFTNPVEFYDTSGKLLLSQPGVRSTMPYPAGSIVMGKGFLRNGALVNEPFDFSAKNRLPLSDLHSMLMALIFPDAVEAGRRFSLGAPDYALLHRYMSMLPSESRFPQYVSYPDAYAKFLLYGAKDRLHPGIRIFNKIGNAYGFLTDAAYIVDFNHNIEFMLSATIYCNSDGIFNDDRYDYEAGYRFLRDLGKAFYDLERTRKRRYPPDLSSFKLDYSQ